MKVFENFKPKQIFKPQRKPYLTETTVLSLEEGHSSLKPHLPELFRNSQHARFIQQTTQPILEEFSTSLRTVGFSKEEKITYATSFFSQVCYFLNHQTVSIPRCLSLFGLVFLA